MQPSLGLSPKEIGNPPNQMVLSLQSIQCPETNFNNHMTNWPILGDTALCSIVCVRRPCARVALERVPAAYTAYARITRREAETRSDQKETALR